MVGKGCSISHAAVAAEYDKRKKVHGVSISTEVTRNELTGITGADILQEMACHHLDYPNVKRNCLRFEVAPAREESVKMTDGDWKQLGEDFISKMGLDNHQYIIWKHSRTDKDRTLPHLHIIANRVSLDGELYNDSFIGRNSAKAANQIGLEKGYKQAEEISVDNKAEIKSAVNDVMRMMMQLAIKEKKPFDWEAYKNLLKSKGIAVREMRAGTGRLFGYYLTSKSGTEYKASEIDRSCTLSHLTNKFSKDLDNAIFRSEREERQRMEERSKPSIENKPSIKTNNEESKGYGRFRR